jgi:hypothetical protein
MKESNLTTKNNKKQELKERKYKKGIKELAKDPGILGFQSCFKHKMTQTRERRRNKLLENVKNTCIN